MADKSTEERIRYRREHAVDPEAFLRSIDAIRPSDGDEQLRFTAAFEADVRDHLETFRARGIDEAIVAEIFGVDEEQVTVPSRPYTAFRIRNTIRNWPSSDALVFDAATDASIREATYRWADVPPRQRYRILQSLRSFQDDCFFCSGTIEFSDGPVRSCCSDRQVLTVRCGDCGRRFLEFTADRSTVGPAVSSGE
ncbi:hypothetical protein AB7C87_04120 [Natrarchaeobius sp. A-rgal3]|uniref:hypothetical protein n=1 Tax=Natrarchaeobius versutus TaxID=1679078 RepID=UPI00350ECDA8